MTIYIPVDTYDPYTGSADVIKSWAIPPVPPHETRSASPPEAGAVGTGVRATAVVTLVPIGSVIANAVGAGVNPTITTPVSTGAAGTATGVGVTPAITIALTPATSSALAVGVIPTTSGPDTKTASPAEADASGVGVKPSVTTGTGFGLGPFGQGAFGG